jgi:hypothetical protein
MAKAKQTKANFDPAVDVTAEMLEAGKQAEADWHLMSQPGSLHVLVFLSILKCAQESGYTDFSEPVTEKHIWGASPPSTRR